MVLAPDLMLKDIRLVSARLTFKLTFLLPFLGSLMWIRFWVLLKTIFCIFI